MIKKAPKAWASLLMKLKYRFTLIIMLVCIISFAQDKILTTDGQTLSATSLQTNDNNIVATVAGENQTILK
jgi:hypothetical protein